jgi:DNA-binding CsgD family transcriptional regulator
LSFSALSDLLEPVPSDVFAALPDPQRRALEVALLRVSPPTAAIDVRAVAVAVRSMLALLADTSPVLVAIDDVQWLDATSARALDFALRRIADAPVSVLASRRSGAQQGRSTLAAALSDAQIIDLGPLSLAAIHEVLKRRLRRALPRPLLLRVHETAGGNPFFALEIARVVIDAEVAPAEPLPLPADLSQLVLRRVRRVRPATRDVLLAVAVAAQPTVAVIAAAVEADAEAALAEAEEAGLLEQRRGSLGFAHPLYAAAVYSSASPQRRREVHRRIAEAVGNQEERARHLALGTAGPDEAVASILEEASAAATVRGALDAAVELQEFAVKLTPNDLDDKTNERTLELAELLRLTGDTARARKVLDDLVERSSGILKARALVDLAAARYWTEGALAAVECCERALRAARRAPALKARAHADLAVYCDFDLERSYRHARAALRLFRQHGDSGDPHAHAEALSIACRGSLMLGRGLPLDDLDQAIELEARASQTEPSRAVAGRITTISGQWLRYVDNFAGARARLEEARRQALEEGDESALPNILAHLAQTELWSGNWPLAAQYAEESYDIAEQVGLTFGVLAAFRAQVDAHLGRIDRARQTAVEGLEVARRTPLAAPLYLRVLGFLDLSLGEFDAAARQLTRALQDMTEVRILEPGVLRIHADAVEALVTVGDLDRADAVLIPWEKQARRIDLAWSLATSARCRSLLEAAGGKTDAALDSIESALAQHQRLPMPFELARTLLVKGEIERRAKHKADAKESLERALVTFDELGAPLWAKRATEELQRIGLRRAGDGLTEGERRVAELAASGLTNREVAAQLFMSPKTVEANLARAYRKLGIRSRAQLGARLGTEQASAQT